VSQAGVPSVSRQAWLRGEPIQRAPCAPSLCSRRASDVSTRQGPTEITVLARRTEGACACESSCKSCRVWQDQNRAIPWQDHARPTKWALERGECVLQELQGKAGQRLGDPLARACSARQTHDGGVYTKCKSSTMPWDGSCVILR
jgi:hypothetical protein